MDFMEWILKYEYALLLVVFAMAASLTWLFRLYALKRSLIDVPNSRSSHTIPTPRGGGVAVVLTFLFMLPILGLIGSIEWPMIWALSGAGVGIALIGFLDDLGHIPARWRLSAHFICATWGLLWIGGLPPLIWFGSSISLGWFGHVCAALYLVWLLNLYNFMDGIDGIASIEAITVCLSGVFLYFIVGQFNSGIPLLFLAASVFGFLVWNFPPAKIFMGDAGSGFLGLTLGIFSLQAAHANVNLLWAWLILLGVFIVDATCTLIRRLLIGEKIYEAHRSHAYQHASRKYRAHKPVSLAVGAINMIWLLPFAITVVLGKLDGALAVLITYTPLILLAYYFDAGLSD